MTHDPRPVTLCDLRRNAYADSVALMQVTAALRALPGVEDAAVVMATPLNREVLEASGLLVGQALAASANDLVVAVRAVDESAAQAALQHARAALDARPSAADAGTAVTAPPRSIRSAARRAAGGAGIAMVSVPGPYAAAEAWQALGQGLHAFVFSDNVPLDAEVALKRAARERGLLVMGPDCGTAILGGTGFGFANVVRSGHVGLVGASGTGLQEVSVLLDRLGAGVSHAIGTGGRDLYPQVGGITTLQALDLLAQDAATRVIVLVSKPVLSSARDASAPDRAQQVLAAAARTGKPVVACLLGAAVEPPDDVWMARTLLAAAQKAAQLAGGTGSAADLLADPVPTPDLAAGQTQVRGLFCGGTLCDEAERLLAGTDHHLVDFGDDRFTRGRAHPMIDPSLRNQAVLEAAGDPRVAVVLLDVILGHGAHPDPAGALAPVLERARLRATAAGHEVVFLAHVLGTEGDPQGLRQQEATLRAAGAHLVPSSEHLATLAARIVRRPAAVSAA